MRAASLLAVLVCARFAAVGGRELFQSASSPLAFLHHDAAVVLLFATVERLWARWPRLLWIAYGVLAGYVALTVPVVRVLSTPLTWAMLHAARGALSDSIWYYATRENVAWMAGLIAVACAAPFCFRRLPAAAVAIALVPLVTLGAASRGVDTRGLERNAWSALLTPPRLTAVESSGDRDWRATRADPTPPEDLGVLHGAAAGRHLVVVSLESTAAQYLGLYGVSPDVMPNLTELSRSAVVFENAYTVYPESIKGLFASICSTYPAFNRNAETLAGLPCQSAPSELARRGYRTALFHSGRFDYLGMNAVVRNRGYEVLQDAGDIGGNHESSFGVDEAATVARILEWVDTLDPGERFFVTYLPIAGHHPYESSRPGPFAGDDEFGRYRNALHDGDAALGDLVRGLRARGLDQNVVWMVFGDHGEAFGQHAGNYGHTFHVYEENVRVPFLIAAPGLITQPLRSRRVVSLLDVAPTLLDLAGVAAPASYAGQSIAAAGRRMALFFADYSIGLLGLRDGPLKCIYEVDSGRAKLFDVDRDPGETHNLAGERPAVAAEYADHLRRWSATLDARLR